MIRFLLIFFSLLLSSQALAHEVRPAYLHIEEITDSVFQARWKQPVLSGRRLKLDPVFPEDCTVSTGDISYNATSLIQSYRLDCELTSGVIRISGLEQTLTDVFVEVFYLNSDNKRALLKPADPQLELAGMESAKTSAYLWIGIEHIIFGWDHLLFVIGLVLLVKRRQIIGVATAFTLAHSITLGLAAMGFINIPIRPVEILIAASIVFLAIEIIRKNRGITGLSVERPYLIGFGIGLIHGCGFASALSEIGLPKDTELWALLLFNIGVELGQIFIICLFILLFVTLTKFAKLKPKLMEITISYTIGTIAMFWFIDRIKDYVI